MKDFNVIVPEYTSRIELEIDNDRGLKNYILLVCDRLGSDYGSTNGVFTCMLIDEAGYAFECGSAPIIDGEDTSVELEALIGVAIGDEDMVRKKYKIMTTLIEDESKICVNVKEV